MNDACYNYLSKYFEKDSILVPSLQRTFCDHDRIKFAPYSQHIRPLLVDRSYRHGHVLHVFPKTKDDGAFNMYKYVTPRMCSRIVITQDLLFFLLSLSVHSSPTLLVQLMKAMMVFIESNHLQCSI